MEYFVAFWIACSVITYGYCFGYHQGEYPTLAESNYLSDMIFSLSLSLVGPFGLFVHAAASIGHPFKHGMKFK